MRPLEQESEVLPEQFVDTEIIADPLNRLISISAFEKRIICCPEFQRLRRIKQLGFANFVYPAAEYSRFVHSLGACHQAKNIVDIINDNVAKSKRYQQWRLFGAEKNRSIDVSEALISPFERVIIAAAALLHDLPHGPFSHEIEGIQIGTGENVIPDHDKLDANPAFFLYLFDKDVSDLACLLDHFNAIFAPAFLKHTVQAGSSTISSEHLRVNHDWSQGIAALRTSNVLNSKGYLKTSDGSPIFLEKGESRFQELPLLPVLIFEILLFEKQHEWLPPEDRTILLGSKELKPRFGLPVSTGWAPSSPKLLWKPIPGWFRAYRKDIIGNTICADLIDYVNRDGYHTGIVSAMDLKFLDRMLIARAVLPPIGEDGQPDLKPPPNKVKYTDIPASCEHVVFDIYDHKRGFIRQSVLTEILAYLQGRYLLCERVYIHRVVEAARSMLQAAIGILGCISKADGSGKRLLSVEQLHPLGARGPGEALAPIGDDALLQWIRGLPILEPATYLLHSAEIDKAIELATLLTERRVFREAIIYDGMHGFAHPGKMAGAKATCRALEAAFLTDTQLGVELKKVLAEIELELERELNSRIQSGYLIEDPRLRPRVKALVGVRKWGKRYKPPLVLVAKPLKVVSARHSSLDIEPLLDCEDPPNIKKQLDAMKDSYDSLWKVYLFLHPVFHDKLFAEANDKAESLLNAFAATCTGAAWQNAVDFGQLLQEPLDNLSLMAQPQKKKISSESRTTAPALAELFLSVLRKKFSDPGAAGIDVPPVVACFSALSKRSEFRKTLSSLLAGNSGADLVSIEESFRNVVEERQNDLASEAAQSLETLLVQLVKDAFDGKMLRQPELGIDERASKTKKESR